MDWDTLRKWGRQQARLKRGSVVFQCRSAEADLMRLAAHRRGLTLSEWARKTCLEALFVADTWGQEGP